MAKINKKIEEVEDSEVFTIHDLSGEYFKHGVIVGQYASIKTPPFYVVVRLDMQDSITMERGTEVFLTGNTIDVKEKADQFQTIQDKQIAMFKKVHNINN